MGDLKKKKEDRIVTNVEKGDISKVGSELEAEDQTIAKLREYMKKFVEMQKEKEEGK